MRAPAPNSFPRRLCSALLALLVLASGLWPALPLLAGNVVRTPDGRVGKLQACSCGCSSDGGSCCCAGEAVPSTASGDDPCFRASPCSPMQWSPAAQDILKAPPPPPLCFVSDPEAPCGPVPARACSPRRVHRAPDTPPPILPVD